MKVLVFAIFAISLQIALGESPPVELLPDRTCPAGQKLCNHNPGNCYEPLTKQCLTYFDGSGGILCPLGNTFCGGRCLDPKSGKECVNKPGQRAGGPYEEICDPGQQICGFRCYTPNTHDCVDQFLICDKGQGRCGNTCYTQSADVECVVGPTGWAALCKPGDKVCGSARCYSPEKKKCIEDEHRIVDL